MLLYVTASPLFLGTFVHEFFELSPSLSGLWIYQITATLLFSTGDIVKLDGKTGSLLANPELL